MEGTVLTSLVLFAVTGAWRSLLVRNSAVNIFDKNRHQIRTRFVNAFKFILSFQECLVNIFPMGSIIMKPRRIYFKLFWGQNKIFFLLTAKASYLARDPLTVEESNSLGLPVDPSIKWWHLLLPGELNPSRNSWTTELIYSLLFTSSVCHSMTAGHCKDSCRLVPLTKLMSEMNLSLRQMKASSINH